MRFTRIMTRKKYSGDEPTIATITLDVDIEMLVDAIGYNAMFNKTHRARAMKGSIKATAKIMGEK